MLQILIWGICAVIFGIGYCGMYLEKLAARDKVKSSTGLAFFILMLILAIAIFALSLMQGQEMSNLLGM
jgi:hypothetical protein